MYDLYTPASFLRCVTVCIGATLLMIGIEIQMEVTGALALLSTRADLSPANLSSYPLSFSLGMVIAGVASMEEYMFRVLPGRELAAQLKCGKIWRGFGLYLFFSFVVFAVAHGSVWHLFAQGIFGVISAGAYLCVGGLSRAPWPAFVSVSAAHALLNTYSIMSNQGT